MNRVLALRLQPNAALAVLVRSAGDAIEIEQAVQVELKASDDARSRGEAIAAGINGWRLNRVQTVVAVPRSELSVQTYDLPPVPAEDLPDLVHLQAQRDLTLSDDGLGFDFLPLTGDQEHPYRILAAGLTPAQWTNLRETCDAADLKIDRIVPEPLGWAELGFRIASVSAGAESMALLATIIERQAVVWAAEGQSLRLIRSVWLPEDDNAVADAAALGGELRRTLLSLAQSPGPHRASVKCFYIGSNAEEIAGELSATISKPVQAAPLESVIRCASVQSGAAMHEVAPLAGLAAALADRRPVLVDLLHPRRRPAPPNRLRTFALAGAAAALLIALVAWKGYRNLQEPLEAAEAARVERDALAPALEKLAVDETKAAAVRRWLNESANLLTELDRLGPLLRPEPLDSDKFKADQDLVVTKVTVANRQITLDAVAKSSDALLPAESRLRAGNYRVERGPVDTNSQAVPGYTVSVSHTVQPDDREAGGGT
jgi:hypothetical protein